MDHPKPSDIDDTIRNFYKTHERHVNAKADYTAARSAMLALVPRKAGRHVIEGSKTEATIEYLTRYTWDVEEISAIYGDTIPPHVKRSYSIDMRTFQALPPDDQEALLAARMQALGTAKIEVTRI